MKNVFYSLLLGSALALGSCSDKDDEPQAKPEDPQFRITVTGNQTGAQGAGAARVSLSRAPIRSATTAQIFMSSPVPGSATASTIDDTKWDKVDFPSRTLYASLYYQDVTRAGYVAPTGSDQTSITVTAEGKQPVTIVINAAAYQDATLRWTDAAGKVHVGKEVSFQY